MAEDGSVVIGVDLETSTAEKEAARLKNNIVKMYEDLYRKRSERTSIEESLDKANRAYEELQAKVTNDSGHFVGTEEDSARLDALIQKIQELEAARDKAKASESDILTKIGVEKSLFGELTQEADRLAAEEERAARAQERMAGIAGLLRGSLSGVAGLGSVMAKGFLKASSAIVTTVGKMNVFKKLADKIAPTLSRIGGLVRRVFVFSMITRGLRALRETMSQWLSQSTELSAALNNLKGAMATAFYPIYQAIIPALLSLLNVITAVISAVARFNAMLFGGTAKGARDNAKALTEQAKATKAAGGAADDAKKSLAAFDEINKLNEKDSGGGGGGGDEAAGFGFDIDEGEVKSWGQTISDFIDGLLEKVAELPEKLSAVAKKINEFAAKLLEAFTFPGLKEKFYKLGEELAKALNGFIAEVDWYTIGAAIGAGLNLLLSTLVGFIYNFDWMQLGGALGDMINGLVDYIDWENVGKLLWGGFKIAIEFLAGLLLRLDMKDLAIAASNIVKGFFNSMTETIQKIDWKQLGDQIATFLVNVDWDGIVHDCFTAIGAAFVAAAEFLWGLIKPAWEAVVEWWHDKAFEDGQFTIEGLLLGIAQGLVDIFTWIGENIVKPIIDAFCDAFGISSPSKVMEEYGGYIADGILEGIANVFKNFFTWLKTNVFDPVINGFKKVFGIDNDKASEMESVGEAISNGLSSGIEGGIGAIKGVLNKIIEVVETAINWIISKANGISFTAPDWVPAVGGKTIGFNIPEIRIPRLAAGAVIPPNNEFLAVLGDQKQGTNIEAPLETIVAAFRQAIGESGNRNLVLQIGEYEFAKLVFNAFNTESGRVGTSMVR